MTIYATFFNNHRTTVISRIDFKFSLVMIQVILLFCACEGEIG